MRKNILVCPLEWGLGHAGRMIPLIGKLISMNHNVIIGTGKDHINFFTTEFPGLTCIYFPGFRIKYSRFLPQYLVITLKIPAFIIQSIKDHLKLKKLIREYNFDIVISDSRTGLWNRGIKTVLITHMPRIPYPRGIRFLENTIIPLARRVINRYSYCYIPDFAEESNISGKLSHNLKLTDNTRFIGLLSRFTSFQSNAVPVAKKFYCTVILSGPEPQKGILKQTMVSILEKDSRKSVILEGRPGSEKKVETRGNLTYINHLPTSEMYSLILESENVVTRSGYTTLMELISIKKSALIIPTPGQPEQEYLAEYMEKRGWFKAVTQKESEISGSLPVKGYEIPDGLAGRSEELLETALAELLED